MRSLFAWATARGAARRGVRAAANLSLPLVFVALGLGQYIPPGGGGSGSGCTTSGSANQVLVDNGSGGCTSLTTSGSGNGLLQTSPTIVTPTIASLVNATHNHSNAAGGGTLPLYGLVGSPLSQFAATTSAQLLATISDETGSGLLVFGTAPVITLPNATGLPAAAVVAGTFGAGSYVISSNLTVSGHTILEGVTSTGATGTGKLVYDGTPTLVTPILGTPTSVTLTNATGLPVAGLSNLGANVGTFLITPSSANLAAAISDETGSGAAVFGTAPTIGNISLTGTSAHVGNLPTGNQNITDNPLTSGATTITVASTTGFPTSGLLLLATTVTTTTNEIVSYSGTTATTFTGVVRGLYGTTGSSHASGSFAIPIESIIASSSTAVPEMTVMRWNNVSIVLVGTPLYAIGNPSGLIGSGPFTNSGTWTNNGGQGIQSSYYQDVASAKGYWATNTAAINWQNLNRVTTNVNVSLDAVTSQTANIFQLRNATPVVTVGFSPLTGLVNTYNATATAGMGVAPVYAAVSLTGQTASKGTTNLQCGGAVCPAGQYKVHVYTVVTTVGTGTLTSTIGWTDPGQAQTITSVGIATTAKNFEQVDYNIIADGIANITYATTLSVTGTYQIDVVLERLQ